MNFEITLPYMLMSISAVLLSWIGIWIKGRFKRTDKLKADIREGMTEAIHEMIDYYIGRLAGVDIPELRKHAEVCKKLIAWVPDKVLFHYARAKIMQYKEVTLDDYEMEIGKMLLSYRKKLGFGFKNWRLWNRITPKMITVVFKAGWEDKL